MNLDELVERIRRSLGPGPFVPGSVYADVLELINEMGDAYQEGYRDGSRDARRMS